MFARVFNVCERYKDRLTFLINMKVVAVNALFKNSESFIVQHLIPSLAACEEYSKGLAFEYYFLENDSTDNTRKVLQDFVETRTGKVFTLDNVESAVYVKDAVTYERVSHFVKLRNYLLQHTRERLSQVDYVVIMDADTLFFENTLDKLIEVLNENSDIVMVSPYQLEYTNKRKMSKIINVSSLGDIDDNAVFSVGHNYDTYALQYKEDDCISWPFCRFKRCSLCCSRLVERLQEQQFIEVKACFNGIAVLRGEAYKHATLEYETLNIMGRVIALCEHVLFCNKLRTLTGKKIVIAHDIIIKAITAE